MLLAVCSANAFLKTLYNSGLWLSVTESGYVIAEGHKCLKHFQHCAERAFDLGFTRWKLQPKYHMLGEVLFEMGTLRMAGKPVPNPLTYSCQMDEDLVGRVSAFSRVVSSRTIHERTLSRYQVALAGKWWHENLFDLVQYVPLKNDICFAAQCHDSSCPALEKKQEPVLRLWLLEALIRDHRIPREVSSGGVGTINGMRRNLISREWVNPPKKWISFWDTLGFSGCIFHLTWLISLGPYVNRDLATSIDIIKTWVNGKYYTFTGVLFFSYTMFSR